MVVEQVKITVEVLEKSSKGYHASNFEEHCLVIQYPEQSKAVPSLTLSCSQETG